MNYRHIYHAGNFTEVVKHSVLTLIIDYLRQKTTPFCFIDCHAGEGIYDLQSVEAGKTGESVAGVEKIINNPSPHPQSMNLYLQILKSYQTVDGLSHYPGSPRFAQALLRADDRMILNEFHPAVYQTLKKNFYGVSQVFIHQRDAYEFLPAVLPPVESRGLVLIDPPFEQIDEDKKIAQVMEKSIKRWGHGVYLLWYPLTTKRDWSFLNILDNGAIKKYLTIEFRIADEAEVVKGLIGCRLLIINPPWRLADTLPELLSYLWGVFNVNGQGKWSIKK